MHLALLGATGAVGTHVLRLARAEGHTVHALVRPTSAAGRDSGDGLRWRVGDLHDDHALRDLLQGADAVISTLGARTNTADQPAVFADALTRLTAAMSAHGPRRLVAISGAATRLPGDGPQLSRAIVGAILRTVARHVVAAKEAEAAVITATDLAWTLARPPRIVDGEPTGNILVDTTRTPGSRITRGDVARFLLDAATGDAHVGEAPLIASA